MNKTIFVIQNYSRTIKKLNHYLDDEFSFNLLISICVFKFVCIIIYICTNLIIY